MEIFAAVLVGLVLLAGAFAIRAVLRRHAQHRDRPGELRPVAAKLGWTFEEVDAEEDHERAAQLLSGSCLAATLDRSGHTHVLHGPIDGGTGFVFDLYTRYGRTGETAATVVVLRPSSPLPVLSIQPRGPDLPPAKIPGFPPAMEELQLAGRPTIAEAYVVRAVMSEREPEKLVDALAGILERAAGEFLFVESLGDRLVVHRDDRYVSADEIPGLIAEAREVARRLRRT